MKKKILSFLLLFVLLFTASGFATACRHDDGPSKKVDPNKTQLYVGVYEGAFGREWMEQLIVDFEAVYTDIQVWPTYEKDLYADAKLIENVKSSKEDLYFVSAITYSNYINKEVLADITDVVTTPLNESKYIISTEETKSIEEKINNPELVSYYNRDGKYYALPFYDAIFGLVYDVDLFESKRLYFNKAETGFIGNIEQPRSVGPDGKEGTYDDGLPKDLDQWKKLLDRMTDIGIIPMTWNGKNASYMERYLMSIWADYEGKANFDLNNTFSGEYTFPGDSQPTQITQENAYLLQKQEGKRQALSMAKLIASDTDYYSPNAILPSQTHTLAQNEFLTSSIKNQRIAMLVDATWWENEADLVFKGMADLNGNDYARGVRRFAFMPAPKGEGANEGTTLLSVSGMSVAFVNAYSQKMDAAKKFLSFAHLDENLRKFTKMTGVPRPYKYELTEEDRAAMSYFGNTLYDAYSDPDTEIVFNMIYTAPARLQMPSYFVDWSWGANLSDGPTKEPIKAFRADPTLTVDAYMQGMLDKYSDWAQKVG